jgi:adenine C2-methylase RlmN of 23S rRNA A2503 and tRNA A37
VLQLKENYKILGRFKDTDDSEKFVFSTPKNEIVELTWIKNKPNIGVICVPTHTFCTLGCKFCHLTSAKSGLTMKALDSQDLCYLIESLVAEYIDKPKILISFMGVGEPLLNTSLILESYDRLSKSLNRKLSFAFATMFINQDSFTELTEQALSNNIPLKVHFSMHSPIDSIRKSIIPSANNSVSSCLQTLSKYRRKVMDNDTVMQNLVIFHPSDQSAIIHYTLIEEINDSEKELAELTKLGNFYHIPIKFIKFNPIGDLKRSSKEDYWLQVLAKTYEAPVTIYSPPGANIGSSCGQFTRHYYIECNTPEDKFEFENWKNKYQISL